MLHGHKGDVGTPNLIGTVNLLLPQKIEINWVLWMRLIGSGAFVDRLQAHLHHQPAHAVAAHDCAFTAQKGCDLAAAEERVFREHSVDRLHRRQRVGTDPSRRVIERGAAEFYQLTLSADAQLGMIALDHRPFLCRAHFLSPSDKKSFSTTNLPIFACRSLTSAPDGPLCLPPENTSAMPSTA